MKLFLKSLRPRNILHKFSTMPTTTRGPNLVSPSSRGSTDFIELDAGIMNIRAFGDRVFQLNDVMVRESVLVFSKSFLIWNAKVENDITIENLAMIPLMLPTIEILIIGTGL